MKDGVEFYEEDGGLIACAETAIVPVAGAMISIKGVTWEVVSVTYALDMADTAQQRMRANVDLRRAT